MQMVHRAVVPLRILLALLFCVLVLAQVGVVVALWPNPPGQPDGEFGYLRWVVLPIAVLGLLCVQVVIVCTGKLLTLVRHDRIFTAGALPWVDGIVRAIAAGWALLLLGLLPVYVVAEVDDAPGLILMHLVMLLVGTAVGLLMLVMRALLRQATTLRDDLEAVI
jgi:hypothetical protein